MTEDHEVEKTSLQNTLDSTSVRLKQAEREAKDTKAQVSTLVNTMAAGGLMTLGARASATMVLT